MSRILRDRIEREQVAIEIIITKIEEIASMVDRSDMRVLGRQRRELIQTMLGHLSCMEMVIYPELTEACRPEDRAAIEMMRTEGNELARTYRLHIAQWNADNLLADWSHYRHASLLLIKRMRGHFERSHRLIHPLLDHLDTRSDKAA